MNMSQYALELSRAAEARDGTSMQRLLSQTNLDNTHTSVHSHSLTATKNGDLWAEVAALHITVTRSLASGDIRSAWAASNSLINTFLRFFSTLPNGRWCCATCVMLLSFHRSLSALVDRRESVAEAGLSGKRQLSHLEECARQLSKAFSICVGDRSGEDEKSKKWATYDVVCLLFRTYFKLKSLGLCRNILRALNAADLPTFDQYPRAQKVIFKYYVGLLAFLNEEYAEAESNLKYALLNCHSSALHNQEMILRYLIPCGMLRGKLPASSLLGAFSSLSALYAPFVSAIRSGNVRQFDEALASTRAEKILVGIGTYLAVERAREICMRSLLKRVYRCKDRTSRIRLEEFHRALRFAGVEVELLETEWLVASQIAKGYIRGYISHPHMTAVLSSQDPFPRLSSIS